MPKVLGYSYELPTTDPLALHAREHCAAKGRPSLDQLSRGTVSKILSRGEVRHHKVRYYLARLAAVGLSRPWPKSTVHGLSIFGVELLS